MSSASSMPQPAEESAEEPARKQGDVPLAEGASLKATGLGPHATGLGPDATGPGPEATGAGSEATGPGLTRPGPSAVQSLGALWLFTTLRFGMFFGLWLVLWLARVPNLLAALIALVLSMPLSYVLLRKPRERVAVNLEQRLTARHDKTSELDAQLAGEDF